MNKLKLIGLGNKDNRNYFVFKKDNSFFSLFPTFLENLDLDKLGILYEHSEESQDINDLIDVQDNVKNNEFDLDIFYGKDAKNMFEMTGCDSVMIARGAMGNPCVFDEIKNYLKGKDDRKVSKKKIFLQYLRYCKKYHIEFKDIRTHAQWFTKGVSNGSVYRERMNQAKSVEDLKEIYKPIGLVYTEKS